MQPNQEPASPTPNPVPQDPAVMQRVVQPEEKKEVPVPTPPVSPAPTPAAAPAPVAIPAVQTPATPTPPVTPPIKKSFFSFRSSKKEKIEKKVVKASGDKKGIGAFFTSINNIGMGKQRMIFVQNMAMMLGAGLSVLDALRTLALETRNRAMKKIMGRIKESVESGVPLWKSMEQQYLFTPYEIALIHIGEDAGHLARNMDYLSIQQEKDNGLRSKVKIAMIYPTIVLTLMFIVVMGLGLFVLPNLVTVLISLNADLPLTTRIVIQITNIFNDHGVIMVPWIIAAFIGFLLLGKYTKFRIVTQWLVFHTPGIGSLAHEATIARFGVILGGMLQAGVPLVESLKSLEEVTHTVSHKIFYKKLLDRILIGDSFSASFASIKGSKKLLPISVQQLIITGEQSGTLAETLLKISDIYDKKASQTAEKLPVVLEPMLLLFVGALVGTIAFAIITPIYGVVGNVGR